MVTPSVCIRRTALMNTLSVHEAGILTQQLDLSGASRHDLGIIASHLSQAKGYRERGNKRRRWSKHGKGDAR